MTSSRILVIDCTTEEIAPAVRDATGAVIVPPVLSLPSATLVDMTTAQLAQMEVDQKTVDEMVAAETAVAAARALVELRMIRDRWLAQTDYIEVYLADPTGFSPLPQPIQNAITANKTGWAGWRQALRDLPATAGLDQVSAVDAISNVHATSDTFPQPWPQPPAAPVIHLT